MLHWQLLPLTSSNTIVCDPGRIQIKNLGAETGGTQVAFSNDISPLNKRFLYVSGKSTDGLHSNLALILISYVILDKLCSPYSTQFCILQNGNKDSHNICPFNYIE